MLFYYNTKNKYHQNDKSKLNIYNLIFEYLWEKNQIKKPLPIKKNSRLNFMMININNQHQCHTKNVFQACLLNG